MSNGCSLICFSSRIVVMVWDSKTKIQRSWPPWNYDPVFKSCTSDVVPSEPIAKHEQNSTFIVYNITDRGEDLGLGDEAVRQLVVVVAVGGDDLRPGHLITSQLLVPQDRGQIPAKDGCQVAAPDLKGRRQVDWLHQDLLRGHCWRKAELEVK